MQLLTIKELMSFLKVKRNTIYELRRKGLPVIHLGRSVRFERDDVINWVRLNCSAGTQTDNISEKADKTKPTGNTRQHLAEQSLQLLATQSGSDYLL